MLFVLCDKVTSSVTMTDARHTEKRLSIGLGFFAFFNRQQ
jgi:hypothetical protein